MPSRAAQTADARFGHIILIYALDRKPLGWINLARLFPLAGDPGAEATQRRMRIALQHLDHHGLIDLDIGRGKARYRRTVRGRLFAERIIRDGRVSFTSALGNDRARRA